MRFTIFKKIKYLSFCSLFIIVSTFLVLQNNTIANDGNNKYTSFFPMKLGNKWIMESYIIPYTVVYSVIDTITIKNKLYYKVDFNGTHFYREDTLGHFYEYQDTSEVMIMDFKMNTGDFLLVSSTNITYCLGRKNVITFLGEEGEDIYFLFDYYTGSIDDEGELHIQEGVGPAMNLREFHWEREYLRGAVINDIVYGDTTITSIPELNIKSKRYFSLKQNYPNPFNSSTIISFNLPKSCIVNLQIFNTLGRKLATLNNSYLTKGEYHIKWDSKNLPSGIYFYRLQTNDFIEIKKLSVEK